jgi:hypothetical protein
MWSVPAYCLLQALALWRLRGGWRAAAIVPAVPMAGIVVHAVLAFLAQSNLFPLLLLFASPPASLYLMSLLLLHRLMRWRGGRACGEPRSAAQEAGGLKPN